MMLANKVIRAGAYYSKTGFPRNTKRGLKWTGGEVWANPVWLCEERINMCFSQNISSEIYYWCLPLYQLPFSTL